MARRKPLLRAWPCLVMLIAIYIGTKWFGAAYARVAPDTPSPLLYYSVLLLQQVLFYFIPTAIYMYHARGIKMPSVPLHDEPNMTLIGLVALMAFLHQLAMQLFTGLFGAFLSDVGIVLRSANMPMPQTYFESLLTLLSIALVPAICEECLFRGAVFKSLEREFSDMATILITTLLFGLMHGSLVALPSHLFAGLTLTALYYRHRRLLVPIVYHFVYNAVSYMTDVSKGISAVRAQVLAAPAFCAALLMLLMLLGLCIFFKLPWEKREGEQRSPSLSAITLVGLAVLCFLPAYLFDLFPN